MSVTLENAGLWYGQPDQDELLVVVGSPGTSVINHPV